MTAQTTTDARGKKVLITGAAGFVGSQLALHLYRQGYDVHLLDNLQYGYRENLLLDGQEFGTFHHKDIRDTDLAPIFAGVDTVFHLAAISALPTCQNNPMEAISINVAGTANVLEQARLAGARRLVFASTSAIYENNTAFPCREDDEPTPTLMYSVSKQQCELLCRGFVKVYGMEIVVTRYYNVYGPQQDIKRKSPPFVGYVIRELLAGRTPVLHSDGEQRRDYVHVDDVNAINMLCMTHPDAAGKTFNVASGKAWSVNEMYAMIADALGSSIKPTFRPAGRFWEQYPELFAGRYAMSESKLAEEVNKFTLGSTFNAEHVLGWRADMSLEEGLRATARHMQQALTDA